MHDPQGEDPASVVQGCFETLDDFQTWDAEAASYWESMFHGRGAPTTLGQVASRPHYDVETACTIILIRSARLILVVSMLAHIDLGEWASVLEHEVDMTIDDILACVPHALGDRDLSGTESIAYDGAAAVMIHQPIRLVASCALATPEQLRRATRILARLNAGIGIRAAVGMNDQDDMARTRWAREQTELRARLAARVESGAGTALGRLSRLSLSPAAVEVGSDASPTLAPALAASPVVFTPASVESPWLVADSECTTY